MSSVPSVVDVVALKREALEFSLGSGIEAIDSFAGGAGAASVFFEGTHLTVGLRRLLEKVSVALGSGSDERVFVLKQGMGGGEDSFDDRGGAFGVQPGGR
jgi:hypothetical protein